MEDKNISYEVLDKIKDIKPKPRWQFLVQDYLVWILASLSLVLSSLAFAVIVYMLVDNDWDVYSRIAGSLLEFIFLTLPYFWLIFLGLFIVIAYYNFRHTKKGYKLPLSHIFLYSLLINVLLGTFLYNVGVGQAVDNLVAKNVPFYKQFINKRQAIWSRAENGLLGGVVTSIDEQYIIIEDIEGNVWTIKHFNTTTPSFLKLRAGQPVRLVGQKIDSEHFEMHILLPMRGMRWIEEHHKLMHPYQFDERKF